MELYHRAVDTAKRRGRVDLIIAKALEDGAIDEGEANAILDAHRRYVSARHAGIAAVIVLHTCHDEK
jgi:hypothetical protein